MVEVNESDFAANTQTGLVLVDFYTTWCGPCKALAPVLGTLQDVKVVKMDVEQNPKTSSRYNVSAVPCLVLLKDGKEVARMVGMQSQKTLQKKIDEFKTKE